MHKQSSVVGGIILILVGLFFLALQFLPETVTQFLDIGRQWPLIIVAVGGIFLLTAFLFQPPMAIPGSILTGIGLMLYYQNLTGHWESWAYSWTLIPGFVGVGIWLMHMRQGQFGEGMRHGGRLLLISLGMFAFFGVMFSGFSNLLWPVGLIVLGMVLLGRNLLRGHR